MRLIFCSKQTYFSASHAAALPKIEAELKAAK
jgi:hypothetical protein